MENFGENLLPFTREKPKGNEIESKLPLVVSPIESGNPCIPAIGITNERFDSTFFQKMKSFKPSGIIYGVGAGNIFSMIKGFSNETPPKGLIMVDVNPAVILVAKMFINGFKRYANWRDFAVNVLFTREEKRRKLIEEVRSLYKDEARRLLEERGSVERFNLGMDDVVRLYYGNMRKGEWFFDFPSKYKDDKLGYKFAPILVIAQNYSLFRKLASEGRMTIVYSDLFNPELLNRVAKLPGIKEENNVIYASNITEVSMPRVDLGDKQWQEWLDNLNYRFKSLNILKPNKPHKNVFIQSKFTLEKVRKFLSIRSTPPAFKRENFVPYFDSPQKKPL